MSNNHSSSSDSDSCKNIQQVVNHGLCTGCAFCTVICPEQCIQVDMTPSGLLSANVDQDRCGGCGHCLQICGGNGLHSDVMTQDIDPLTLPPLQVFLTRSSQKSYVDQGQSGGSVTAVVASLIQLKRIDGVICTVMPDDGTLRPQPKIVRELAEIPLMQGSKYVHVPLGQSGIQIGREPGAYAIIGLPCHFHSLVNTQKTCPDSWVNSISLKVGLVCDRALSCLAIDYILNRASLERSSCQSYRFRAKEYSGYPGEGLAILHDGRKIPIVNCLRLECKDALTPLRCHLCFDKMNIFADLVACDPWGIRRTEKNSTVLLARTEAGLNAIIQAVNEGVLYATPLEWSDVLRGQCIEEKRFLWTNYMKSHADNTGQVPQDLVATKWHSNYTPSQFIQNKIRKHLDQSNRLLIAEDRQEVLDSVRSMNDSLNHRHNFFHSKKRKLRVMVTGIGVSNKGSELMLYAILQHLEKYESEIEPVFGFYISEEDMARFKTRQTNEKKIPENIDYILDASGFCFGDQWADGHVRSTVNHRISYTKNGGKLILLPQALGSFHRLPVREYCRQLFRSTTLVCSRDPLSFQYVSEICDAQVPHLQFPDFTCEVSGIDSNDTLGICSNAIAILPNIRMLDKCNAKTGNAYLRFLNHAIHFMQKMKIPHYVLCHQEDDIRIMEMLEPDTKQTAFIQEKCSLKIKGMLSHSRMIIGSRYHGLISGLCQGVPCIGTSWSHKYQTLFDEYECSDWLLKDLSNLKSFETLLAQFMDDTELYNIRNKLLVCSNRIKSQVKEMWSLIDTILLK